MAFLRDFRKKVALLKRQGLVASRVDARSAFPSWKSDGTKLSTLINKYDDVVSGKVTAVKVDPKTLSQYRAAGYETSKGHVMVPHAEEETARRIGKTIVIKNKSGIERIQIPIEYHNAVQYLRDIRKNQKLIDAMKYKNEAWGFRVRSAKYKGIGGYSTAYYTEIDLLIDELERYDIANEGNGDLFDGLEIFRISNRNEWGRRVDAQTKVRRRKGLGSGIYNPKAAKRRRQRNLAFIRAKDAEKHRIWRAKLKDRKKEEYKRKARKRAKRSRK